MFFGLFSALFRFFGIAAVLGLLSLFGVFMYLKYRVASRRAAQNRDSSPKKLRVAFFHPKCNAGGGGEKVLWCMIDSLMEAYKQDNLEIAIYTGGQVPDEEILKKAEDRFEIKLPYSPKFIRVERARMIDPDLYPVFTMVGQIFGTIILAANSLEKYVPDYFIDTTGLAFSYWFVKFLAPSCKIGAYVHYPFISHEMLNNIVEKKKRYNNNSRIADSPFLSAAKIYYYKLLVFFYGVMGNQVDFAWANSSWTGNHIKQVWSKWGQSNEIKTLYPPCNVRSFSKLSDNKRKNIVLSFAQYRPEKNHRLQLEVFKEVLNRNPGNDLRFYIIGSCRGAEDEDLLKGLKDYASELNVADRIEFFANLPLSQLLERFEESSYAIHTMEAEHFGIAVVEMMAAGLAVTAHNSAGPKLDIIKERKEKPVGYLASSKEEYIEYLDKSVKQAKEPYFKDLVTAARRESSKFSDEKFKETFKQDMRGILKI